MDGSTLYHTHAQRAAAKELWAALTFDSYVSKSPLHRPQLHRKKSVMACSVHWETSIKSYTPVPLFRIMVDMIFSVYTLRLDLRKADSCPAQAYSRKCVSMSSSGLLSSTAPVTSLVVASPAEPTAYGVPVGVSAVAAPPA